jgi:molybdenum cofactor biosynthesis enzyme MoaA
MKPILYGIRYVLLHHFGRRRAPLICGLVLTNKCNLRCQHCRIPARGERRLRFDDIARTIESFYREGGRSLYLEGGEPMLWRSA